MEKYIDFDYQLKEQVRKCVLGINNSRVTARMNTVKENNTPYFRLSIIGNENEVDSYLEEFNSLLTLN